MFTSSSLTVSCGKLSININLLTDNEFDKFVVTFTSFCVLFDIFSIIAKYWTIPDSYKSVLLSVTLFTVTRIFPVCVVTAGDFASLLTSPYFILFVAINFVPTAVSDFTLTSYSFVITSPVFNISIFVS